MDDPHKAHMLERFQDELTELLKAAQETQPGEFPADLEAMSKHLDDRFLEALDATFSDPEEQQ
jgi:hypothetical protein